MNLTQKYAPCDTAQEGSGTNNANWRDGTEFLRERGYSWDGRQIGSVSNEQREFENRMWTHPFRGKGRG